MKFLFRHAQKLFARQELSGQGASIIHDLGQKSGLQDLADALGCRREGSPHTAGSDALLTGNVFWQMRQKIFEGEIPEELVGMIWGLSGVGPPASSQSQAANSTPNTNGATLHSGMTPQSYKTDGPTTPQTAASGLAPTPNPHAIQYAGLAAGGAFSNFQYGAR